MFPGLLAQRLTLSAGPRQVIERVVFPPGKCLPEPEEAPARVFTNVPEPASTDRGAGSCPSTPSQSRPNSELPST